MERLLALLLCAAVLLAAVGGARGARENFRGKRHFPLYKQCNPLWGSHEMGVPGKTKEDDTICDQGCAMSSLSMALSGYGFTLPSKDGKGTVITPDSMNTWLRANNGYECAAGDCCNLVLAKPDDINPARIRSLGEPKVPFVQTLKRWVTDDELIVIAHVRNQSHFVLLTGGMQSHGSHIFFEVNDPGFNQTRYAYDQIHDVLLYNIL